MCKYVVIDLEMGNSIRKKNAVHGYVGTEVIQIGAVLLNEEYVEIDSFKTYVKPQYSVIGDKVQKLTGITNTHVKDAPLFEQALNMLCEWVPEQEVEFVAWSPSDQNQIRREMDQKNIQLHKMECFFENWTDCQATFGQLVERDRCVSLQEALIASDISYQEGAHDALVDAHNTALLFAKMETEDVYAWNPYYRNARGNMCEHLQFGMGSLLQGLCLDSLAG